MAWTSPRSWITGEVLTAALLNAQVRDNLAELLRLEHSGFRNQLINGSFRVNQRAYASGGVLASGVYGFDRWKATTASSTLTFTTAPNGQPVTINSGGSFAQVIERANVPAGTYILSWTGTATGRAYNSGAAAGAYAASPVVVTVDGTADLVVEFTAVGAAQTLGNAQFEAGVSTSGATAFERRPIGGELALCQRYYQRIVGTNALIGPGLAISATAAYVHITLIATMRAAPTFGVTNPTTLRLYNSTGGVIAPSATPTLAIASPEDIRIDVLVATGLTAGNATILDMGTTAGTYLEFTAEL